MQWMSCQAAAISGAVGEIFSQSSEHMQNFSYKSSTFAPHCLMSDLQSMYTQVRTEELVAIR